MTTGFHGGDAYLPASGGAMPAGWAPVARDTPPILSDQRRRLCSSACFCLFAFNK
jgi:hypothetical protein